jgi:uncharacterized membrane protein YhhN
MKTALYVTPALAVTVFLLVRAEILKIKRQIYLFKPISTLLVITVALLSFLEPTQNPTYSVGVLLGLLLSFGGDLALMFQENRKAFMLGLALFLLAHVAYTVVLTLLGRFSGWDALSTVVLLAAGVSFYWLIQPNLGTMRVPVMVYILVISAMVSRAASTLASPLFSGTQATLIVVGAVLFYLSDLILAAARFWRPWTYNRVSLAFYYGGQTLIALAASYFGTP